MAAFSWRATRRECFLPGWSNQVLTRDCQSLRKWLRCKTLFPSNAVSPVCPSSPPSPFPRSSWAVPKISRTRRGRLACCGGTAMRGSLVSVVPMESSRIDAHPWLALVGWSTREEESPLGPARATPRASLQTELYSTCNQPLQPRSLSLSLAWSL